MIAFEVHDMSCGHCASMISKALRSTDRAARITIDLPTHRVMVEPTEADAQMLCDAIADVGYTPVPVKVSREVASNQGSGWFARCG